MTSLPRTGLFLAIIFLCSFAPFTSRAATDTRYYNVAHSTVDLQVIEQEIIQWINFIRDKRGLPHLSVDQLATLALRSYAESITGEGESLTFDKIAFRKRLWRNGGTDYAFTPLAFHTDGNIKKVLIKLKTALAKSIGEQLISDKYNMLSFGVRMDDEDLRGAFSLSTRKATLQPFPRTVSIGKTYQIAGSFIGAFQNATLFVTSPNGTVIMMDGKISGNTFTFDLTFPKETGRYSLEVLVKGPKGPTVSNLFPVFADVPEDYNEDDGFTVPEQFKKQGLSAKDAEQVMLILVNRHREKFHLKPLVWNEQLAAISRTHSADMQDNNFFGHKSPTTGSVVDRGRSTGLAFRKITENLGKDRDIYGAFEGLLESPGHRLNILDKEVSQLGVGVSQQTGGALFVTLVFIAPALGGTPSTQGSGTTAPGDLAGALLKELNGKRSEKQLPALTMSAPASDVAKEHARLMLEKKIVSPQLPGEPPMVDRMKGKGVPLKSLSVLVTKGRQFGPILATKNLESERFKQVALGVVEDPNDRGVMWMTIVFLEL